MNWAASTALGSILCLCALAGCTKPTLWLGAADSPVQPAAPSGDASAQPSQPPDQAGATGDPLPAHDAGAADATPDAQAPSIVTQQQDAAPPAIGPALPGSDAGTPDSDADGGSDEPAMPTGLPVPRTRCPRLTGNGTYSFGDPGQRTLSVQIYMAADAAYTPGPGGPLILYWHAFGSNPSEVMSGLGQAAIDDVVRQGGVVAAFTAKVCPTCGLPEDVGWYNDDDAVSDAVVGCAIQQAKIDLRRIHSLGLSAGALRSIHLATVRSSYIASVVSYSGGSAYPEDEPTAAPPGPGVASLLTYGRPGRDTVGLDFTAASERWYGWYSRYGWYVLMCEHDGGHEIPSAVAVHAYQFLVAHPYGVRPEPYAKAVPPEFPSYCQNKPPMR